MKDGCLKAEQQKKYETKNQHYVPRFYFRFFSNDKKTTNLFNVEKGIYKLKIPISSQCSEDYFYGSDGAVEKMLGKLESECNILFCKLDKIKSTESLPRQQRKDNKIAVLFTKDDLLLLRLFAVVQYTRTKNMQMLVDEIVQETLRVVSKYERNSLPEDLFKRISLKNGVNLAMFHAAIGFPLLLDLNVTFLVNESKTDFILGDNPIVLFNPLMEKFSNTAAMGIASRGLIIFFPISARLMVCLYDVSAYKFEKEIIALNSSKEVDEINAMQMLVARQNVYFTREEMTKEYFENLLLRYPRVKRKHVQSKTLITFPNEIVHAHIKGLEYSFKFRFFKIKSETLKKMYETSKSNGIEKQNFYCRDERLACFLKQFMEKVKNGICKVDELNDFLRERLFGDKTLRDKK